MRLPPCRRATPHRTGWFGAPPYRPRQLLGLLGLHHGYFDGLPVPIVGGPLADLFAVLEVARAHDGSVLAEPLPVPRHHAVDHLALPPNRAVLVVINMLLGFGLLCRHCVDSS